MPTALVLGANGFIGSACVQALAQRGFDLVAVGRSKQPSTRAFDAPSWVSADITRLSVDDWEALLENVDVVINASGALQDGSRDSLDEIHIRAIEAFVAAAPSEAKIIQVSAAGVADNASTHFFRTKAKGDAAVMASANDWVILRPTLVIGPAAYGGTALLRSIAALPGATPDVFKHSKVQTISLGELADAVAACAAGDMPLRCIYDLTESETHEFTELVVEVRRWLGIPGAHYKIPVSLTLLRVVGRIADGLGWLGWRAPLRTTAVRTMQDGVSGDPTAWKEAGGQEFSSLSETLASLPSTIQERMFARLFLFLPLAVATLSIFWIWSGVLGFIQFDEATNTLTARNFSEDPASAIVAFGSIADIALGMAILFRRWARHACLGMVFLSLSYLLGGTVFAPDLWSDPLGPFVKVLPAITLALLTFVTLEER